MLMKYVLLYLCIHDPGHRAKPRLEADQVEAEPNQDHGGVLGRAVLGNKYLRVGTSCGATKQE